MDNIIRMSLEDLLGSNSYFRPYDVAALTEVSATEQGNEVLRELMQLYMSVDFNFSSPGNSFARNVLIEVTKHFRIRHDELLLLRLGDDDTRIQRYHAAMDKLIGMLRTTKTRVMDDNVLDVLKKIDEENAVLELSSVWHTPEGIEATLRSYANLPDRLLGRIQYAQGK